MQKCIGTIDGTHVAAWAPANKQTAFRGRKVQVTQNVMCACSFDMMFTFVYTGWEGTANDSRVFLDAIMREENNFPFPNEGITSLQFTIIFLIHQCIVVNKKIFNLYVFLQDFIMLLILGIQTSQDSWFLIDVRDIIYVTIVHLIDHQGGQVNCLIIGIHH